MMSMEFHTPLMPVTKRTRAGHAIFFALSVCLHTDAPDTRIEQAS
ncbi:hypothetical protein [Undibacterium rivi]|nr:hypothetical protein [Undibacterium rivi]